MFFLDQQKYKDEEIDELSKKLDTKLFFTWSKENKNVTEVFEHLGNVFMANKQNSKNQNPEENKTQGPVPTIRDIGNAQKVHKLSTQPKVDGKKKKKGAMSWWSIH